DLRPPGPGLFLPSERWLVARSDVWEHYPAFAGGQAGWPGDDQRRQDWHTGELQPFRAFRQFCRLAERPAPANPERILRFANRYGWLGAQRVLVPASGSGSGTTGEALSYWVAEIERMRLLRQVWHWVGVLRNPERW